MILYHDDDHNSYITDTIYQFHLNGFLTNLHISTNDDSTVDCHKAALVAQSESCRRMFDDDTSDVGINVIGLNATCDIVKEVLQFIYKGMVNIHAGNVESLFAQGIHMQLHQLNHRCKEYMEENLSVDNVIQYHEQAMNLHYEPLYMITRVYIKNECVQLLPTENFAKLGIANLTSLLSYMNRFSSVNEHIKLDIILQWRAAHDDCDQITELLNVIKFDELPIDYLKSNKDIYYELGQQHRMLIQKPLLMIYEEELTKQCEMLHQRDKETQLQQRNQATQLFQAQQVPQQQPAPQIQIQPQGYHPHCHYQAQDQNQLQQHKYDVQPMYVQHMYMNQPFHPGPPHHSQPQYINHNGQLHQPHCINQPSYSGQPLHCQPQQLENEQFPQHQ